VVTLHGDNSVSVADNGRGTDTRYDDCAQPIKKPVRATRDLRFFDFPDAQTLPDGHPRRGMSTVAALSEWLTHTNRRSNGAWTQRYEHGLPVTDLSATDDGPLVALSRLTDRWTPLQRHPSVPLFGVASDSRAEPVENGIGELCGADGVDVMAGGDG